MTEEKKEKEVITEDENREMTDEEFIQESNTDIYSEMIIEN